jgi:hypothetical protein
MNVFKVLHIFLRSFLLAQKRTKKGSRSLDPQNADFPALLARVADPFFAEFIPRFQGYCSAA